MLSKAPIFLIFAALLLIGLWLGIKPPQTALESSANRQLQFQYQLQAGHLTGPTIMSVQQGDQLEILLLSDNSGNLHLHGYELIKMANADIPVQLTFTAEKAGRFELELHGPDKILGTLEVYPSP